MHAIDPHRTGTEAEFRSNLAREGLSDWTIPHVAKSQEFVGSWQEPIRLLFIDGLHTYEGARSDYLDWGPFVVPGGVIVLHDTFKWEGPRRVVEEFILGGHDVSLIGIVDSITAVKKISRSWANHTLRHVALRAARRMYLFTRRKGVPGDIRKASKRLMMHLSRPV